MVLLNLYEAFCSFMISTKKYSKRKEIENINHFKMTENLAGLFLDPILLNLPSTCGGNTKSLLDSMVISAVLAGILCKPRT